MKYQIKNGTVSVGGQLILSHINFEIRGSEKIAVVGRNGAGKTTLLRLLAGEIGLDRDDKSPGMGIYCCRQLSVEFFRQQEDCYGEQTVEEEVFAFCPPAEVYEREYSEFVHGFEVLFTGFGFKKENKNRRLSSFSAGQRAKIALAKLLLKKPDILLLDEPTNHLDTETVQWLERYLASYEKAVVIVSHDRFFLDRTVQIVYELEQKSLIKYTGNYSSYREQKRRQAAAFEKAYRKQQEEIARLKRMIERFKHKPSKAAFARSKKKALERIEQVEKPLKEQAGSFQAIVPNVPGSKWTVEADHLKIGYDKPLFELDLRVRRGQKIGVLGVNGSGKTALLKTIAGFLQPLGGKYTIGNQVEIGYFDQLSAGLESEKTVVQHFSSLFPLLSEKEVRVILGTYLFQGEEAQKQVSALSGGEKSRLILAELLQRRPNFLILDEPTNHMDIPSKETLEAAFCAYEGTILFVSHDRYFISQVAQSVLILEGEKVLYYPFGYKHYLERKEQTDKYPFAAIEAREQAMIAEFRAVPRTEPRFVRGLSDEEAHEQWKAGQILEEIEKARSRAQMLHMQYEETIRYCESKFWLSDKNCVCPVLSRLKAQAEAAGKEWHSQCLKWYETATGSCLLTEQSN